MPHVLDWSGLWHNLWYNLWHLGAPDTTAHPVSLLEKLVRPAAVYLLLVFALRHAGKRMLAQLNPFDFVVLLTLSNTVQNAIIGNDTSLLGGAVGALALLGVNALLVRYYYRGPEMERIAGVDRDTCLIAHGELRDDDMRRLHINAGELTAKAHERGFDSLGEVDSAVLYPNGTIYFRGRETMSERARHEEILRRLDSLAGQVAALRR